jgi:hypothetical protein
MRNRVYGLDVISKTARGPLVVDADSEEAARALAGEQGMQAEAVEPADVPILQTAAPVRPAAEPITSRDQLRRLGRVAEAYGFRFLVIGCLMALLILAIRIDSQLRELQSQADSTRSAVSGIQAEVKDIRLQVDFIRTWMPRR